MTAAEHAVQPEELMAYLDGELPSERAVMVQTHVTSCAVCQQVSEDLRGVSRDLVAWRVEETPATLRVPSVSADAPARSPQRWLTWRPALVIKLGGAVALVILGIVLLRPASYSKSRAARPATPSVMASESVVPAGRTGWAGGGGVRAGQAGQITVGRSIAPSPVPQQPKGPMIVRTATLQITTNDFEAVRPAVDRILSEMGGFVGQVDVTGSRGTPRSLRATLRVPAARLDATLAAFKKLGQVVAESQGGDDVTEQVIDLEARLTNNRNTEKRLTDLLQKRTGDLADVLAAEREIARVRDDIERLDAQRKNLEQRVTYATLTLQLSEEHKAELDLGTISVSSRFRNAMVDGFRAAFESALEAALFVIRVGPFLLLWALVLLLPGRMLLRRLRRANA